MCKALFYNKCISKTKQKSKTKEIEMYLVAQGQILLRALFGYNSKNKTNCIACSVKQYLSQMFLVIGKQCIYDLNVLKADIPGFWKA